MPEWGFQQYEVVTEREFEGQRTVWVVEELKSANVTSSSREEEEEELRESYIKRLQREESGSRNVEPLGFLDKYFEIQVSKREKV